MYVDNLGIETDCDYGVPIISTEDMELPETFSAVFDKWVRYIYIYIWYILN